MIYVSRSSSGDFLEIWPDLAKSRVWEGRNLGVWIFSGVGRGWDPSGWICIDVRTPKPNYFPIWDIWGSVRAYFPILSYYLGVPPGSPIGPFWPVCNSRYTAHWPLLVYTVVPCLEECAVHLLTLACLDWRYLVRWWNCLRTEDSQHSAT